MLRVVEIHDQGAQWLGVADIMRAEAHEEANTMLARYRGALQRHRRHHAGMRGPRGRTAEEILKVIEEDEDIAVLMLAAGLESEGPGPLVASLGKTAGTFPCPSAIVPGHLSDEEIDAMS